MFRKNDLFLAQIQIYQRIQLKIIDIITSRVLLIFPEISGNIKFPENWQPCIEPFKQQWLETAGIEGAKTAHKVTSIDR